MRIDVAKWRERRTTTNSFRDSKLSDGEKRYRDRKRKS